MNTSVLTLQKAIYLGLRCFSN